jgi:hypothetical protein
MKTTYSTIKALKDSIKNVTGFDSIVSRKSPVVLIVSTKRGDDREQILKNVIAPAVDGNFISESQIHGPVKSSIGAVEIGRFTIIAKEEITTIPISAMTANTFVSKAVKEKRSIEDKDIEFYTFTDYVVLEQSIIEGCLSRTELGESIADAFKSFFASGSFTWGSVNPASVLNTLGVYVGELLSGWVFLKGSQAILKHVTGVYPFRVKATKFYLPVDSKFAGVDSYLEVNDTLFGISNKAGAGAPASFFTNILPHAVKSFKLRQADTTLKTLINISQSKAIAPTKAKELVYAWGVNKHLGLRITNPHTVIDGIINNKLTPNHYKILHAVEEKMKQNNDSDRLKLFPYSLSSYFNNQLALALSKDSIPAIIKIVSAKTYFQFNLNANKFLNGELEFKSIKAGKTNISIKGNASAQNNLGSNNGWINYSILRTKV